jgi:hypothetical protein
MGPSTNIPAARSRSGLWSGFRACAPWVFVIDQLRRGRHGKIPMPNGRSARSDGNASIIAWSSENGTFVTRCYRT